MTTAQFNKALQSAFKVKSIDFATIEQVQNIIEENDLKERFSISSGDLEIEDYDNVSRCFELEEYKTNVLLAVGYTDSDIKNFIKKAKGE